MTTQEREDDAVALSKAKGGSGGGKKGKLKVEVAPSPQGIRVAPRYVLFRFTQFFSLLMQPAISLLTFVAPRIAEELRTKVAKAAQAKEKKGKKAAAAAVKEEDVERDEFDMMVDDKAANREVHVLL